MFYKGKIVDNFAKIVDNFCKVVDNSVKVRGKVVDNSFLTL